MLYVSEDYSFLLENSIPLYHNLSFHSAVESHLGSFQILAVMNKAAGNIYV